MSQESVFELAYRGKTAEVKTQLEENEKLKTQTDNNGRMLLHWAALGGHDELVQHLLSLDVPVDPADDTDMTPLILAASAGRGRVVSTLLSSHANVNAITAQGHSALQYAASKNWMPICAELLEYDANVNIVDNTGATPLHRAASKGNGEIVKMLIDTGKLKIDQKDIYGNTALHLACEENRMEEAKLLVNNGANVLLKNKEQKTPLDLASPGLARQLKQLSENLPK